MDTVTDTDSKTTKKDKHRNVILSVAKKLVYIIVYKLKILHLVQNDKIINKSYLNYSSAYSFLASKQGQALRM